MCLSPGTAIRRAAALHAAKLAMSGSRGNGGLSIRKPGPLQESATARSTRTKSAPRTAALTRENLPSSGERNISARRVRSDPLNRWWSYNAKTNGRSSERIPSLARTFILWSKLPSYALNTLEDVKIQTLPPAVAPRILGAPAPGPEKSRDHSTTDKVQLGADLSHIASAAWYKSAHPATAGKIKSSAAVLGQHGESLQSAALRGGAAVLSGAVALASTWHGVALLRSKETFTRLEGANHLVLAAGSGLVAAHLGTAQHGVSQAGAALMLVHGVGEVGLGAYRALREEGSDRTAGLLQMAHGACLVGAELFHGAALPLCLIMAGITGTQMLVREQQEHE